MVSSCGSVVDEFSDGVACQEVHFEALVSLPQQHSLVSGHKQVDPASQVGREFPLEVEGPPTMAADTFDNLVPLVKMAAHQVLERKVPYINVTGAFCGVASICKEGTSSVILKHKRRLRLSKPNVV